MIQNKTTLFYRVTSKRKQNFLSGMAAHQLTEVRKTYDRRVIRKILSQLKFS